MKKYFLAGVGAVVIAVALVFSFNSKASKATDANVSSFYIATYNVENLFDMVPNGSEYPEYIPNFKGWDEDSHKAKLANAAQVIKDMNADIVVLQEIENENALKELLSEIKKSGVVYPNFIITKNEKTAVQNALISKFNILSHKELDIAGQYRDRPILKATLSVGGAELIVYANHWKAKTGPESKRIEYASVLAQDIKSLPSDADYVVMGDLNSNYNEMETFQNNTKLNNTNGLTAINHIIKTAKSAPNEKPQLATKADVMANQHSEYLYNLWLEIPKYERVSEWFGKERNTPDNIIVPKAMFDRKGISYEDESFKIFAPSYLLKNGRAFRWEGKGKSKALSVPQGYSDHLPLLAKFRIGAFESKDDPKAPEQKGSNALVPYKESPKTQLKPKAAEPIKTVNISDLYGMDGSVDALIKNAVVIHKHFNDAVLKQKNGRAVFAYNAPADMEIGGVYDVRVGKVEDYHGLREIKRIIDHKKSGKADPSELMLKSATDLTDKSLQNEVISGISGLVSKGKFLYNNGKEIKIYFKDKALRPKNLSKITLKSAHLSFYNEPQIVIYQPSDFELTE